MFRKAEQLDPSACPPWGLLLRHVVQAEGLTREQQERAVDHIARCEDCTGLYEAMSDADEALWEDAHQAAGVPKLDVRPTRTVEDPFAQTWRRTEAENAAQRRGAMVLRIADVAAAAFILIAIGIGWVMMHRGQSGQSKPAIAANVSPAVFAELAISLGHEPMGMNQPIPTGDQPLEILVGWMHSVVISSYTTAPYCCPRLQHS